MKVLGIRPRDTGVAAGASNEQGRKKAGAEETAVVYMIQQMG